MSHRIPTLKLPNADAGALVASRVITTKPCKLLSIVVLNTNAAIRYFQIHETASLPADGAVPDVPSIPVSANSAMQFDFGAGGLDLDALTICNSTTAATKTIGAADAAILAILQG